MQSRKERRAAAHEAANAARRAEINLQNAQHSTGPRTQEGKAKSSRNSFKHGLYSTQLCRTPEEALDLDALKADLWAEHQPGTTTEELLANEMAEQYWRLKRARRNEAAILNGDGNISHLAVCQRMMSSAERGFHKALATLRRLQAERGFVPQEVEQRETEFGFVPQNEPESVPEPDPFVNFSPNSQPARPPLHPAVAAVLKSFMQRHADGYGFVPQNPAD